MSNSPKKATPPRYPSLAEVAARPAVAGLGAALIGAATLAGCGLDPLEEQLPLLPVMSKEIIVMQSDAGPAEPSPSDLFAGGAPGPDYNPYNPYDGGQQQ